MTETQKQPKNNRLKWQKTKRHDSKTVSCYCQLNLASLNASRCQIWSYLYRSDWGSVSNSKVMQTWSRKAIYYNYFYLSRSKSVIFFYCINCPMKIIELTKHSKRGLILCPVRLGRRPQREGTLRLQVARGRWCTTHWEEHILSIPFHRQPINSYQYLASVDWYEH